VIPPAFNTDGIGESKRSYTLPNKSIPPPLPDVTDRGSVRLWRAVTPEYIARLVERSRLRVAASAEFAKLAERVAAQRERAKKGIVRIADLLKGKDKDKDKAASPQGTGPVIVATVGSAAGTNAKTAAGVPKKLSSFQLEALEILADHVGSSS
jgi:hypothetical protein